MTANWRPASGWNVSGTYVRATDFDRRATDVLRSFNTWAFKREQPSEPDVLAQTVALQVFNDAPVSFVLYWGKGPRAEIAAPDRVCLDYLTSMGGRIAAVHGPGARFNLCLTDTHARLNGHSDAAIDCYFGDIADAAAQRGMASIRLSQLVAKAPKEMPRSVAADPAMLSSLERCAARWYRGGSDPRQGARTYLDMNAVESAAVAAHFRGSIFVTFNGSAYRALFPSTMPVFYMNSLKRGTAIKPWFMDEHCQPYGDADAGRGENVA